MRVLGPCNSHVNLSKRALARGNDALVSHFDDPDFVRTVFGGSLIR